MIAAFPKIKINLQTILLVFITLYIIGKEVFEYTHKPEIVKETTEITTEEIRKTVETAVNNAMATQEATREPFIVYRDRVVKITPEVKVPEADKDKVKDLNVYRDTLHTDNGKVYSEIASTGLVHMNKITTELNTKIVTKTITQKERVMASGVFISPEGAYSPDLGEFNVGLGINYISKNDFGVGAMVQYDFGEDAVFYGGRIFKRIF